MIAKDDDCRNRHQHESDRGRCPICMDPELLADPVQPRSVQEQKRKPHQDQTGDHDYGAHSPWPESQHQDQQQKIDSEIDERRQVDGRLSESEQNEGHQRPAPRVRPRPAIGEKEKEWQSKGRERYRQVLVPHTDRSQQQGRKEKQDRSSFDCRPTPPPQRKTQDRQRHQMCKRQHSRHCQQIGEERKGRGDHRRPGKIRNATAAHQPGRHLVPGEHLCSEPQVGRFVDAPVGQVGNATSKKNRQYEETTNDQPDESPADGAGARGVGVRIQELLRVTGLARIRHAGECSIAKVAACCCPPVSRILARRKLHNPIR